MATHAQEKASESERSPILPGYYKQANNNNKDLTGTRGSSLSISYAPRLVTRCNPVKFILCILCIALIIVLIVVGVTLGVYFGAKPATKKAVKLSEKIAVNNLVTLLEGLSKTSVNNSRSVLNGYNLSAEYVYDKLKNNGYDPRRQFFTVPEFSNDGPAKFAATATLDNQVLNFEFAESSQFNVLRYSGSCEGDACKGIIYILDDGEACDIDSFPNVTGNTILMNYTSNCSLYDKAYNAWTKGAQAVIFMTLDDNPPPAARVFTETENATYLTVDIPSISVTLKVGQLLEQMGSVSDLNIEIQTFTTVTMADTYNVLAYTSSGRSNATIVMGSHLDSVPPGPGINDNGSGSMANLEIAIQMSTLNLKPKNRVLFAFWGAEELGLLGSKYFVANLNSSGGLESLDDVALNLNFDMIASPNYQIGIYNGSSADDPILNASTKIQEVLKEGFDMQTVKYDIVPFTGRSDYGPFIEHNIPAGGLFTGAEVIKDDDSFDRFGGLRNAPFDPCYHQFCDTIKNINTTVYQYTAFAAAYALETFMDQDDLRAFLDSN